MDNEIFIGIDTSNYTTSVSAYSGGKIISERRVLPVEKGGRGLRQSNALFEHIKALPELYKKLTSQIDTNKISAVGVSFRPRNIDGSYMPVFLAGEGYAGVIADTLNVPLYKFSHQEGHIAAAVAVDNLADYLEKPFLSAHLSGGTCEILKTEYRKGHFKCDIAGKTSDISAGQFIDRVGVSMGMKFPCGKEFEKLAFMSINPYKFPISVKENEISFSGVETKAQSVIGKYENSDIAMGVLMCITKSLRKLVMNIRDKTNINDIIFVGGVAADAIIKQNIGLPMNVHFCSPEYAADNAVGVAYLAMKNKTENEL